MKIAIVDDLKEESDQLSLILTHRLNHLHINDYDIYNYTSGEEFLDDWTNHSFDLIILDIFMKEITGIDVARKIRKVNNDVLIVFCTTSNDFASESYEVNAQFYLRKPYDETNIDAMLSRLHIDDYELKRSIVLPNNQKVILRNIVYTNYSNHVVTIHQRNGEDMRCYMSQMEAENLLCKFPYFIVPSKGIIVNLYEIIRKNSDSFTLSNNKIIPISRRKSKEVINKYAEFCFEKLRKEM